MRKEKYVKIWPIKNALDSIGTELELNIDSKNFQTIHLQEVVQCLRRSYYDRIDSIEIERRGFFIGLPTKLLKNNMIKKLADLLLDLK